MPRRELLPMLEGMPERIRRIEDIVDATGNDFELLEESAVFQDAFTRNFEVLGKAVFKADKLNSA